MGKSNGPKLRVKFKRKDGAQAEGTNRDGESYKANQVEVLTIWEGQYGMNANLAPGFALTYNGKPLAEGYLNVFDGAPRKASAADDDTDF